MFDKKTLTYLSGLSDDKLETMARMFASGCGVDISKKRLDRKTLAGIRAVMTVITDGDIERATELISVYKKGKKLQ